MIVPLPLVVGLAIWLPFWLTLELTERSRVKRIIEEYENDPDVMPADFYIKF